ncbi:hypothetical protein GOP47_0023347 [Adiantum capillus-veneris]|uniref:Uncharacterized protein n=1 Tax=Adiantum capillus-veneris TaxID=13818 RepID=A0A9D4U3Q6_ADICA|nr:hypothetical protein GOP47_0023347 [Adiantum capillus-veneris]
MGGYIPSKGYFTVNIYDLEGEQTLLIDAMHDSWDDGWKELNQRYEEELLQSEEWGPYLIGRMLHILDGNNRH